MRRWHAETAWLGPSAPLAEDVLIEAHGDRFTAVAANTAAALIPPGTVRLPGLTLPGLANAHSHAFHRALRGGAAGTGGAGTGAAAVGDTFWTWRERMYAVAERLDPGTLLRARPRRLRGDGAGRDHLRRGVPLPAPRPGREGPTATRTSWAGS